MEPISIRELVAWVLVLGLLVTLASSKRRTPTNSKHLVPLQVKNPQKQSGLEKHKMRFETTPPKVFGKRIKFNVKKKQPEAITTAEGRPATAKVAGISKPEGEKRSGRRRPHQVPGSSDRPSKVRNRSGSKRHGSAPHKGPKRSA